MDDPTQPAPIDTFAPAAAPKRLYSPTQIRVSVFLGSPLAGGWMLGQNRRAQGLPGFWLEILKSMGVLAVLMLVSLPFPKSHAHFGEIGLVAYSYWAGLHKDAYQAFLDKGGQRYSNWRVVRVALLSIVAFFVMLVPFAGLIPDDDDGVVSGSAAILVPSVDAGSKPAKR